MAGTVPLAVTVADLHHLHAEAVHLADHHLRAEDEVQVIHITDTTNHFTVAVVKHLLDVPCDPGKLNVSLHPLTPVTLAGT